VKRILLISYYFPPSGGPGVQRILKFARYLPDNGWLPTVLTVNPKSAAFPSTDESLLDEIPPEVEVIHTPAWDPFRLYARIQGKKKNEVVKVGYIEGEQIFKKFARWLRGNIFLPDARVGWVPYAIQAARRLLKTRQFNAIMSTGPPHSSHLIGLSAHKASGLPWVVDMRDPWVEIYYSDQMYETALAQSIQTRLERKVLSTATAVICVSNFLGGGLQLRAPIKLYETIPNGFDPSDIRANKDSSSIHQGKTFKVAHVGTYNLLGHSDAFVLALKKVKTIIDIEVNLVGSVDSNVLEKYQSRGIKMKSVGYVPHRDAIDYMNSANLLLLALPQVDTSSGPGLISGKVLEYLSTRRPILALGRTDGDLAQLLQDTGAGEIFDHNDQEGIYSFVKRCIDLKEQPLKINEEALSKYERPRLTSQLAQLLDHLTNTQKN